ncbi:hypothetical protein [Nocardioides sp. BYT-33-1]|uniref:hypothetical protein n=1 Tax=Nocardioides sp. BYT-33-1 TaxID=3416952 RepID=UPI003F53E00A
MRSDDGGELESLLLDYEQAREDERQFQTIQASVIALAMTALSILGAIVFAIEEGTDIPKPVIAIAPMIVLVPLVMIHHGGAMAIMRSFYMRALERTIRQRVGFTGSDLDAYPGLRPISYTELSMAIESLGTGSVRAKFSSTHAIVAIVYPTVLIVFGGLAGYFVVAVGSTPWRMVMVPFYSVASILLLVGTIRLNLRGRENFEQYVDILGRRLATTLRRQPRPSPDDSKQRSATSYFLLPRPDDTVKGVFVAAGVLAAVLHRAEAASPDRYDLIQLGVLWIVVEYLVYQARYQWNDIVGRREDAAAPSAVGRGRLPDFPGNQHVSWVVIVIRLYLAAVLLNVPWHDGTWGLSLTRGFWSALCLYLAVAIAYEAIRWWLRSTGTCTPVQMGALFAVVGLGYPARFYVGWSVVESSTTSATWLMMLALWGLGVSFVALTWALEGAGYFYADGDGLAARRSDQDLAAKPHLEAVLGSAGWQVPSTEVDAEEARRRRLIPGNEFRILPSAPPHLAPWHLGMALWFLAAGPIAGRLAGISESSDWALILASVAAATIAAIPTSGAFTRHALAAGAIVVLVGYATWAVAERPDGLTWLRSLVVVLVALVPALVYGSFHGLTYARSRELAKGIVAQLQRTAVAVYAFISGDPRPPKTAAATGPDTVRRRARSSA